MSFLERLLGKRIPIYVAHAAVADRDVDLDDEGLLPWSVTIRSADGKILPTDDMFIVKAEGNSMADVGIRSGSKLLARRVEPALLPRIAKGAIVVVSGDALGSNTGRRLRKFDRFENGEAHFLGENKNKRGPYSQRRAEAVVGLVTYTLASPESLGVKLLKSSFSALYRRVSKMVA